MGGAPFATRGLLCLGKKLGSLHDDDDDDDDDDGDDDDDDDDDDDGDGYENVT